MKMGFNPCPPYDAMLKRELAVAREAEEVEGQVASCRDLEHSNMSAFLVDYGISDDFAELRHPEENYDEYSKENWECTERDRGPRRNADNR